jgi:hypothetical protein
MLYQQQLSLHTVTFIISIRTSTLDLFGLQPEREKKKKRSGRRYVLGGLFVHTMIAERDTV